MSKQKKIVSVGLLVIVIVLLLLFLRSCSRSISTDLVETEDSTSPWVKQGTASSSDKKVKKKAKQETNSLGSDNGGLEGQSERGTTANSQVESSSGNKEAPSGNGDATEGQKNSGGNGSGNKGPTKPEEPEYQFETVFKETYLAWSNLQAQGLIEHSEYVEDMLHISKEFTEVSKNAQKKRYKGTLTEEEINIYSFYGDYAKDIKTLSELLAKKKFAGAETLYQEMLVKETTIKE